MGFFNESEIHEMKGILKKEDLDAENKERDEKAKGEANKNVLRKAFDMYLEAVKEYPHIASEIGVSPLVAEATVKQKTLFGTKDKCVRKSVYWVCWLQYGSKLAVDVAGNLYALNEHSRFNSDGSSKTCYEISPISKDDLWESEIPYRPSGVNESIFREGGLAHLLYTISYEIQADDDANWERLISLYNEEQIRSNIKKSILDHISYQKKMGR